MRHKLGRLPDYKKRGELTLLRQLHPDWTLEGLGHEMGTTREAVRIMLNKLVLPTKQLLPKRLCSNCEAEIRQKNKIGLCLSCIRKLAWITFICFECGKSILRRRKEIEWRYLHQKQKFIWCSYRCHGIWLGRNYGKGKRKINGNERISG